MSYIHTIHLILYHDAIPFLDVKEIAMDMEVKCVCVCVCVRVCVFLLLKDSDSISCVFVWEGRTNSVAFEQVFNGRPSV